MSPRAKSAKTFADKAKHKTSLLDGITGDGAGMRRHIARCAAVAGKKLKGHLVTPLPWLSARTEAVGEAMLEEEAHGLVGLHPPGNYRAVSLHPSTKPKTDKSLWGDGPWQTEPDDAEWEHAGLLCLLHRNTLGAWCGYVGVPEGHPAFGAGYEAIYNDANAHGGLTYADGPEAPDGSIRFAPPGDNGPDDEPRTTYWFGFDCAHSGDFVPAMASVRTMPPKSMRRGMDDSDTYKDIAYATKETNSLAEQLATMVRTARVELSGLTIARESARARKVVPGSLRARAITAVAAALGEPSSEMIQQGNKKNHE